MKTDPRDGDSIFHCGHLDTAEGSWIVICPACLTTGRDPLRLIRGDDTWRGDQPVDYREPS